MKKRRCLPRAIVVITIFAILLWLPLFLNYYGLMEADFLATNLSFENTDLDVLPLAHKSQLWSWGSGIGCAQWMNHLFKDFPVFHNQIPAIENKTIALRC
jgi:hypothetical protein